MTDIMSRPSLDKAFETCNRATLLAYVASTPLSSVQSIGGLSLSFVFAAAFFAVKILSIVVFRQGLRLSMECATVVALLLYLVGADSFIHGESVQVTYYVTFLLNCVMLAALVDEFRRSPTLRNEAIAAFCGTIIIMAICMLAGVGTSVSQDGRITFMGVNENEMALICLTAFTFVALYLINSVKSSSWPLVIAYLLAALLIIIAVRTGTRFTLFALYFELAVLGVAGFLNRKHAWLGIVTAASWFVLAFTLTISSPVMLDRLDPSVGADRPDSNGAMQLGGRLAMWKEALLAFQQSPLFGLGYTGYENMQLQNNTYFSLPHNFGLEIAAMGGAIGLTLLLILLFQLSLRIYAGWVMARSLDLFIVTIPLLAAGMFLNIVSMKIVWFLLAVLATHAAGQRMDRTNRPAAAAGSFQGASGTVRI